MTDDSTDIRWLDQEQQRSWRAFLVGTTLLMDRLDRDLREHHNLSMPEYEILVRLSEAEERRLRMAVLADSAPLLLVLNPAVWASTAGERVASH